MADMCGPHNDEWIGNTEPESQRCGYIRNIPKNDSSGYVGSPSKNFDHCYQSTSMHPTTSGLHRTQHDEPDSHAQIDYEIAERQLAVKSKGDIWILVHER